MAHSGVKIDNDLEYCQPSISTTQWQSRQHVSFTVNLSKNLHISKEIYLPEFLPLVYRVTWKLFNFKIPILKYTLTSFL